ncbi:uncharacterized protein LOC122388928 [Amphibalanus amphitrite]|uniref:uncharacterized protein LOC122388928 n=1 Tax=Amphibalanus amphitrite TaxID=1232801 RepID=UPI001C91EDDE|nr:uncharacterized protein LOC122388928 [Amphibalanus amphitrite]XP_043236375.1 uncharacterized protein LOC122388928 [Amphibalanus amphitrite]
MPSCRLLWIIASCLLAGASGFNLAETKWTMEELPPLETKRDVDSYLNFVEQKFRVDMSKSFMKEYTKRSAEAGVLQTQIEGLGSPRVLSGVNVSASDFFTLNGRNYAVISEQTLSGSYIALVSRSEDGTLLLRRQANFSVSSFVDHQYSAAFQASLQSTVIRLKAHVYNGTVFIMTELADGRTLLFLVSDPRRSWLPKYQDSVLSPNEVASDFLFFEQTNKLHVIVTVSYQRISGVLVPARRSYIYQLAHGVKWLQTHAVSTPGGASSVTTYTVKRWTYIAIGQTDAHSLLYRLHWDSGSLELFQYFSTRHAIAVEAFTHHTQTYVLAVNRLGNATVFWWTSDQLFEWQSIGSGGDNAQEQVQFGHVGTFYNGESYIYLVSGNRILCFTTFSSQTGNFALVTTYALPATTSVRHVQTTLVGRDGYYLLVSTGTGQSAEWSQFPLIVREAAGGRRSATSQSASSDALLYCLEEADKQLTSLDHQLDKLLQLAESVFVWDEDRNITGNVTVTQTLTVSGAADVAELQIVSHDPSSSSDAGPVDISNVHNQIEQGETSLRELNASLQNALTASGKQIITGHYSFSNLVVHGSLFVNEASHIETLNGASFQRLMRSTLTYTGNQTLHQPITIGSGSVNRLTLDNGATVNGLGVSDLMYISGPQTVSGRHQYHQVGVNGHLWLTGTLNGLNLTSVVLQGQTLTVPAAHITQASVEELTVTKVNQRELSAWQREAIALDRSHTLSGHVIGGSVVFSDLRVTRLNGRHLDAFLRTLWRSPNDEVAGTTTLLSPVFVRDLTAGRVNGVALTSDLLTTDMEQTVTSHLRVDSLQVTLNVLTDWVNGLDLSRDVVRTTGYPGHVNGSVVIASDLAVTGDVIVADDVTVNDVDISVVSAIATGARRTLHFTHSVLLSGDWTVTGAVTLLSVNGYRLDRLGEVFWIRDGDQTIEVPVTIANKLSIKHNLTVATINGASTDSFIDIQRGGTLYNDVIFLGNITVSEVTLPAGGRLNGRDLSEFAATVVTSGGDQLISGQKVFSGAVRTAALMVRELNGLRLPDDVIMVDRDAIQTGSLTFLSDLEVVSNVSSSGDVDVLELVNGYRVSDILANISNVWVNRTTNHVLIIEGNVHFYDVHILEELNQGGVLELLEGLLYTERDTLVPGEFTVQGDVSFNSQLDVHMVNERPWTAYLSSLILSDVGGTVSGVTRLTSLMSVTSPGDILVTTLNGYTVQQLYSRYLTLHTHQLIRQKVTVQGTVNADVLKVNRVNGVPVNQIMFTDRDIHFYQSVHFFSDVAANELSVYGGTIGDCNLTKLWEEGLRKTNASQAMNLSASIGSLIVKGDVTISQGDVMGQLVTLLDRIVTERGNHTITGEVTFQQPLALTEAEVVSYNGNNLVELCEDALTTDVKAVNLSHPLRLLGPVTFRDDVTVTGDVTVTSLNEESVDQWLASLVLRDSQEVTLSGPLRIQQAAVAGHVLATGPINGQPQSAWVERGDDITASRLYFDQGLLIIDELDVAGLVDGVNVTDVLETAVDLTSNVTITADVTFAGDVTVWMHLNTPAINDLRVPEDVLVSYWLDGMQTISGAKHFDTLVVEGNLCGPVNGVELPELCRQLLSSDPTAVQVVTQKLAFQFPPANIEEPVSGLADNLTAVTALLRERKGEVAIWTERLREEAVRIRNSAAALLQTPDYSVDLAYLLEVQRLPMPHAVSVSSSGRDLRSLDVLLRSRERCDLPTGCLCRSTRTLQVQSDGLLSFPGSVLPVQSWTFHVRELDEVVTVIAHTEGDNPQCRSPGPSRVSVTSRPAGDPSAPPRDLPLATAPPGHLSDVQLFSFDGKLYMVLAYGFAAEGVTLSHPDTELLVLEGYHWRTVQRLPAFGAYRLDLTLAGGVPHLLVVNRHSREPLSLQGEVQLWVWNKELYQFSELRALFHADIQAVAFLHAHEKVFVVIADLDGLTVLEYSAEDNQYVVCQYLAEPGISAVTSFIVGAESYLTVFSTKLNELVVYLVTHQEGLRRHCWYPAAAVRSLAMYSSGQHLLLAAVHRQGLVVYRVVVRGRLSLVTTSAARLPPPTS